MSALPSPTTPVGGKNRPIVHSHSSISFYGTLHALPLIPQRIKSKFLLSADKMLKPAQCPFPSLYKVKLFGRLFKSPDGYLFQEIVWTASLRTDWNSEE